MAWTSDDVFSGIEKAAAASGYSKRSFLHPEMMLYLKAAYDPFTQYYAKRNEDFCIGTGEKVFSQDTWTLLDMLASRALTGHAADNAIDMCIFRLSPRSARLFCRILNKDLRMGLAAKSINAVFPGLVPTHDIMLAKLFDEKRVKFPCFASTKIDGVRAIYRDGKFFSRKGLRYVGLKHLEEQLSDITEVLDGELVVPFETFQVGSGMIRRNERTPTAQFHIFEVPTIRAPFMERATIISDLHQIGDNVLAVEQYPMKNMHDLMAFYHRCRKHGFEGSIVRPWDYQYVGTRSYSWMKMKNVKSADLIIIDYFEGKGKYAGQLGGFVVKYGYRTVKVGSGFTDEQRVEFFKNPESYIDKIAEVLYMEETDDGSLRHPRFVTIRHDK